jgi:hypothetical protein
MEHIHSPCLIGENEGSVLEEMLIRIIGRDAAEHALTYVKEEIKASILYNNP